MKQIVECRKRNMQTVSKESSDLIAEFKEYLRGTRSKSGLAPDPDTISSYGSDVKNYLAYLERNGLKHEYCIERIVDYINDSNFTESTVHRKLSSMKSFLEYLNKKGTITPMKYKKELAVELENTDDIFHRIRVRKTEDIKPMPDESFRDALDSIRGKYANLIKGFSRDYLISRNLLCIGLMRGFGFSLESITEFGIEDLIISNSAGLEVILILKPRGKHIIGEAEVFNQIPEVSSYHEVRQKFLDHSKKESGYLILSKFCNKPSSRTLRRSLRNCFKGILEGDQIIRSLWKRASRQDMIKGAEILPSEP